MEKKIYGVVSFDLTIEDLPGIYLLDICADEGKFSTIKIVKK